MQVTVKSAAVYLAPGIQTGAEIAHKSGVPLNVVVDKMGIKQKRTAPPDMHPTSMAVRAAQTALLGVDPASIDAVIWTGSEYKDHIVWTAAIHVQRELGLKNAFAFDLSARCSTGILGMSVAEGMMKAQPHLRRVLLCGGHRTSDLVDYSDPNTRFLYNLADGGSAMLLERHDGVTHGDENVFRGARIITDGAFSQDVIVPGGGTKQRSRDGIEAKDTYLRVPDPEGMKQRLDAVSLKNFLQVIRESAGTERIGYLALLHMKRSAHDGIVDALGLSAEQSIYLDDYGHFGSPDQVLSLGLAEKRGLLKPGDLVVMASAGIGYMWAASSFVWQRPVFSHVGLAQI